MVQLQLQFNAKTVKHVLKQAAVIRHGIRSDLCEQHYKTFKLITNKTDLSLNVLLLPDAF